MVVNMEALSIAVTAGAIAFAGTLLLYFISQMNKKLDCLDSKINQTGIVLYKFYLVELEHHEKTVKKFFANPVDFKIFGIKKPGDE